MGEEDRVKGLKDEGLDLTKLQDPGDRYELGEIIGTGVTAKVYLATDKEAGGKSVAVKILTLKPEYMTDIEEEYKILRDLSDHPNLPDFYGAYRKLDGDKDTIWFVMQLCEGGPVTDMVRAMNRQAKKMNEIHIAFIIREVLKALTTLHENHIIHRDVKASNILLTRDGEVKLVDFGLSRELSSTMGKRQTSLGSPCWMAPEVVTSKGTKGSYDNRADVWALGITAIELGDGRAPFQDMHPTRALFQIVRNPPPTLYRPANWSQNYNDFISECLVKNPEHRPYMAELMEHPFLAELPDNDHHLNAELRTLLEAVTADDKRERKPEVRVKTGLLQKTTSVEPEQMHHEDLAALESLNEDSIMQHLEARYKKGQYYTYVGDILLFSNPNKMLNIYGFQNYNKYKFKSRSDNEPHIFGVADSAYQDMLHHNIVQSIIISGETMSGKTSQCKQIIRHLTHLGMCNSKISERVLKGVDLLHAFGNAATPENPDSTRHASVTQVTFSNTGKLSGAIFWIFQLEKFRVTGNRSPYHANFHVFYYFYDGIKNAGELDKYQLEADGNYCYLRRDISEADQDPKVPPGPREDPEGNVAMFKRLCNLFADLDFSPEEMEVVWRNLAAIILLGEIKYKDDDDKNADIEDTGVIEKISSLLGVDSKRLSWALCNYCVIEQDTAARRRHSRPEALLARNVFAQNLYSRLVDWIVNNLNQKISLTRAVYGDHHCINVLDIFGFECYPDNSLEQLFVNSMNEQIQYFYNQRIFIAEMQDEEEEEVEVKKLQFFDNRETIDELMNKPNGVLHILDEANKLHQEGDFVVGQIKRRKEGNHVKAVSEEEFTVAHYTGKVTYDAISMCSKNRDFLPPELTEVMRSSTDPVVKQLFTNKLSRTGNVTILLDSAENITAPDPKTKGKKRWGALLMDSKGDVRRYNTISKGEFSQTRGIRTASATFRSTSLEILRMLSLGSTHFVRCLRTDLSRSPDGFQPNIVKQQLRALAVIDTARARKIGFSHRIAFDKFIDGYQFLAFDFDETVDKTKENCRLLMIRLKMEGWRLGNTKVFLKYYNEEFLSRLYETQVKKIVKVQSMLRAFLAKRSVAKKKSLSRDSSLAVETQKIALNENEAATVIQRHMKGYCVRRKYGPLTTSTGKLDNATAMFIREYFKRWQTKSIFQVLLLYRAQKHQDLIYFSQQVHLYSQSVVSALISLSDVTVELDSVDSEVDGDELIGKHELSVWKLPFRIKELPFMDSSDLCNSVYQRLTPLDEASWDEPFKILHKGCQTTLKTDGLGFNTIRRQKKRFTNFVDTPFDRDPESANRSYSRQSYSYNDDYEDYDVVMELTGPSRASSPIERLTPNRTPRNSPIPSTPSKSLPPTTPTKSLPPSTPKKSPGTRAPNPPPLRRPRSPTPDRDEEFNNNNELIDFRRKLRPTRNLQKIDPVVELEMKGKEMNLNSPDATDEPPYNFQAMLRKTDNKFSVHKSKKENGDETNNNVSAPNNINERLQGQTDKQKCFIRKDSFENLKRIVATSKDFAKEGCRPSSIRENGETVDNFRNEILPGFVVIGKVTDL